MEPVVLSTLCLGSGCCCFAAVAAILLGVGYRMRPRRPAAGELAGVAAAPRPGQVVSASMTRLEDLEDGEGETQVMGRPPPMPPMTRSGASAGSPAGQVPGFGPSTSPPPVPKEPGPRRG